MACADLSLTPRTRSEPCCARAWPFWSHGVRSRQRQRGAGAVQTRQRRPCDQEHCAAKEGRVRGFDEAAGKTDSTSENHRDLGWRAEEHSGQSPPAKFLGAAKVLAKPFSNEVLLGRRSAGANGHGLINAHSAQISSPPPRGKGSIICHSSLTCAKSGLRCTQKTEAFCDFEDITQARGAWGADPFAW
jgi:hypothetical protein